MQTRRRRIHAREKEYHEKSGEDNCPREEIHDEWVKVTQNAKMGRIKIERMIIIESRMKVRKEMKVKKNYDDMDNKSKKKKETSTYRG